MEVSRFGLEFNPFLKNSKEILVETAQYREALFRLSYLAKTKGFGLLTGGPGRGKTTAVRNWAAALNPSLYKVVYSCLSTLTVSDFYRSLVESLGGQPPSASRITSVPYRRKSAGCAWRRKRPPSSLLMKRII